MMLARRLQRLRSLCAMSRPGMAAHLRYQSTESPNHAQSEPQATESPNHARSGPQATSAEIPTALKGNILMQDNSKTREHRLSTAIQSILGDEELLFWNHRLLLNHIRNFKFAQKSKSRGWKPYSSEVSAKYEEAKRLLVSKLTQNQDAEVFQTVILEPDLVLALFSDDLDAFDTFLNQIGNLQFRVEPRPFQLKLLVSSFIELTQNESKRLVFSSQMTDCVNRMSANQKVSLLALLSESSCRAVSPLEAICSALVEHKQELPLVKYLLILNCLANLNFHHMPLISAAVAAYCEEHRAGGLSLEHALRLTRACRKLRFKSPELVAVVTSLIVPALEGMTRETHAEADSLFMLADYVNSLAVLNVNTGELSPDFLQLLNDVIARHQTFIEHPSFLSSLATLDLITEQIFMARKREVEAVLTIPSRYQAEEISPQVEYLIFCTHRFLARAVMSEIPAAVQLRDKLSSSLESLAQHRIANFDGQMSEAQTFCREFLKAKADDSLFEFPLGVQSWHRYPASIGLGVVEDVADFPAARHGMRGVALLCPTVAQSLNMFEQLTGETQLRVDMVRHLGYLPFVLNPCHWQELHSHQERTEYLNAKWTLEVTPVLR